MVLEFGGSSLFTQTDVRETPTVDIGLGTIPIGGIVPWLKSFANTPSLPANFVEADGSAINDAESVFDGQNSPDLNGGIFMRGFTSSGGTGGSETADLEHTHTINGDTSSDATTTLVASGSGTVVTPQHFHSMAFASNDGGSTTQDIKPKFYNIVWIMRIK